ncbi:MAG: SDR family NAD(P)-dependent oxidoreductase [Hyphomicrobiaceae bacterium]|nr:SDR family NAD(P)-dependent oxidoreductase [Hyphomicrobiaceae bacterium]
MTEPLTPPKRKNPLERTRAPLLPSAIRSRTAQMLTLAAAEGWFALPTCLDCGAVHYPPRDACPKCLSARIAAQAADGGGRVAAETAIRTSTDPYFRERMPWRIGTVVLDAGPSVIAHLHGDVRAGDRTRLEWKLDKSGQAVAFALPQTETANMADDPQLREMTLDPKFRRVLVTDARTALGQAMVSALSKAGAGIVFAGLAEPWKPAPAREALTRIRGVEIVPIDVTDTDSVNELAGEIGAKVDILINTAEHVRPGGLMERKGVGVAREELEAGYLGLIRLAQAFGPTMRFRGADGANSACAWVNVLSVFAQVNWPQFGAHSASQAAMLSAAQSLRAELRPGGVRVINVFTGPLETEWYQAVPPPKVAPSQVAGATIDALQRGLEDVWVGDIAQDVRSRLAANPKAIEREL